MKLGVTLKKGSTKDVVLIVAFQETGSDRVGSEGEAGLMKTLSLCRNCPFGAKIEQTQLQKADTSTDSQLVTS